MHTPDRHLVQVDGLVVRIPPVDVDGAQVEASDPANATDLGDCAEDPDPCWDHSGTGRQEVLSGVVQGLHEPLPQHAAAAGEPHCITCERA